MRHVLLTALLIMTASAAGAHPGHLVEVAGHAHWIGAAAIGLAVLVGLWGARPKPEAAPDEDETAPEEERA